MTRPLQQRMHEPQPEYDPPQTDLAQAVSALSRLAAEEEPSVEDPEVVRGFLERYLRELERLVDAAGGADFLGLYDVCQLFLQDLYAFGRSDEPVLPEDYALLQEWPALLQAYLENPADPATISDLLERLHSIRWATLLEEQDAEMLAGLLNREAESPAPSQNPSSLGESVDARSQAREEASGPGGGESAARDLCSPGAEDADGIALDVERAVEALVRLADTPKDSDDDAAAGAEFREHYAGHLHSVAAAAAAAGSAGLHDACQFFQEHLETLATHHQLSGDERSLLKEWPPLLSRLVDRPGSADGCKALVGFLQDPRWPKPIANADAQMLESFLLAEAAEAPAEAIPISTSAAPQTQILTREDLSDATGPDSTDDQAHRSATDVDASTDSHAAVPSSGPTSLSAPEREVVDLLLSELEDIATELSALAASAAGETVSDGTEAEIRRCGDRIGLFGDAVETVGFAGLHHVCHHLRETLPAIGQASGAEVTEALALLRLWAQRTGAYLRSPRNAGACAQLAELTRDPRGPKPSSEAEARELAELLANPDLGLTEEEDTRQSQAQPEDVSLELPADVNPELLDSLLQELPTQTEEFAACVQRLVGGGALSDVEAAQRIAHTLKGAANTVGVRGIAVLAHRLEDILMALSRQGTLPTRSVVNTLVNASDCLEMMSEALTGLGAPPAQALGVLQEVLDCTNRIEREGPPREDRGNTQAKPELPTADAQARASETEAAAPQPDLTPSLRVAAPVVDNLLRLVGENIILTGQVHERLDKTAREVRSMQQQFRLLQLLSSELEQLIELQRVGTPGNTRSSEELFDPLELEQYSELHTCGRRLLEAATDAREAGRSLEEHISALDGMLTDQRRINLENQEAVLQTRMVPVRNVVSRLQRSVRQTCRLTGKQAALRVVGEDTLIDSDVLTELVDPLMHLLRNAVDHGVELPEERRRLGKSETGQVTLEFSREGNHILVRCQDDGGGLDVAAVRQAAQERGLVTQGESLTRDELARFILQPTFSTRRKVTQTSGRGIGLDAVYDRVMDLSGSLDIHSENAGGLLVELRLPVTLISTHALLVRVAQHIVAVSDRGVEQILHSESGELHTVGDEITYQLGNEFYTAQRMEALLNIHSDRRASDRSPRPALVVRSGTELTAVMVEEVLDTRELVVKGMGRYLPKIRGIVGATILGDGRVTPVVDLPELLRVPAQAFAPEGVFPDADNKPDIALPCALVVDDSLSARRALAQFMSDSGYDVRTARDGIEAIEVIDARRPDVLLVDLEMPRMNGMELAHHVRARADTKNLPVIMITSRSTEKHRRQAEAAGVDAYLVKPFAEDDLLQQVTSLRNRA